MTPMERRKKIKKLAETDGEYQKIRQEYDRARQLFDAFTLTLPEEDRNLLQSLSGMGYFLHSRMISLIAEHMVFPEELQ